MKSSILGHIYKKKPSKVDASDFSEEEDNTKIVFKGIPEINIFVLDDSKCFSSEDDISLSDSEDDG